MRTRTPSSPPLTLTVAEDPVTGTWTFQLKGHFVEIERTHGFVKLDGTLHHAPLVQGLSDVQELAGAPLDYLTRLIETSTNESAPSISSATTAPPKRRAEPRPSAPITEDEEQRTTPAPKKRRAERATSTRAPAARETASTADEERTVLTTLHAARYLGLSPATLETLRTRGGGPPFVKLGRRVVYRKDDLETWLAQRLRRSTSDPGEA